MALEGTINILGSPVKKKTAAIAGGGILVIGGVIYYRRKRASAASASASGVDTSGSQSNIDPATGYVQGSAADIAALQAQNSGGQTGLGGTWQGGGTGTPPGNTGFTNNAQWAQFVEQAVSSSGTDSFAAAIGKYLTGQPLTADQVTSVQEAIAIGNYPPVSGPDGFPPSYRTNSGGPPPPPPDNDTVRIPNLIGGRVEEANSALQSLGLKSTFPPRKPNTPYFVTATSPKAGATVKVGSTVHLSTRAGAPDRSGTGGVGPGVPGFPPRPTE